MAVVDVSGTQVSYYVDGEGPGLVLVHGTGADAQSNWGHLVGAFAQGHTVVRPEYSGSGGTVDDGAPLTMAGLAAQVIGAAEAAGLEQFDLVGFSLGACISAYIAAEYPERVRSVVLLAGVASGKDSRLQLEFGLWRELIDTDRRAFARLVLLTGYSPDFLSTLTTEQLEQTMDMIISTNWWEGMARQVEFDLTLDITAQLGRISQPALVIGCAHDHMVPPSHSRALAAAIPGASYAELNSGHLAPMECPEAFVGMVLGFIDKTVGQSR